MRIATGPGKILERQTTAAKGKGRAALLYNFDIDDSQVKAEHQRWLLDHVVPILTRARRFTVALKGTASRSGAAGYNMQLSQRRVEAAEAFLRQHGVRSEQLSRTWVGESEAAAFGKLDGSESEEDRAIAIQISGPNLDVAEFRRLHWWDHRDGFDPEPQPKFVGDAPWKMAPAYGRTAVRIVQGAGWKLLTSDRGIVDFIDPDSNRNVDELIVTENDTPITLAGHMPGPATVWGEDIYGTVRALLQVSVLEPKVVRVAVHYVEDSAKHKTTRVPGEEKALLAIVNGVYQPQANITFQCIHAAPLKTKEDWGNPVTYKEMGGEFLPLLHNYALKSARINLFFVWDYEPGSGDTDAEVDNIGGDSVIFEDNAGKDTGLSLAHEFGHNLGLPHRETRKELVMWPFTDQRGGVLERDQILTAHAKV